MSGALPFVARMEPTGRREAPPDDVIRGRRRVLLPGFRKGSIRATDFSIFKRPIIVIASEAKQSSFLEMR
jgi:hypothetical protein